MKNAVRIITILLLVISSIILSGCQAYVAPNNETDGRPIEEVESPLMEQTANATIILNESGKEGESI